MGQQDYDPAEANVKNVRYDSYRSDAWGGRDRMTRSSGVARRPVEAAAPPDVELPMDQPGATAAAAMRRVLLDIPVGERRLTALLAAASALIGAPVRVHRPDGRPFHGGAEHERGPRRAVIDESWARRTVVVDRGEAVSTYGIGHPELVAVCPVAGGGDTTRALAMLDEAAYALAHEAVRLRTLAEEEIALGGGLAGEILRPGDPARLRWIAEALDYDLDRPHRAVICSLGDDVSPDADFVTAVHLTANQTGAGTLVFATEGSVALLATSDVDWLEFQAAIEQQCGRPCFVGIGDWRADVYEVSVSSAEAHLALRLRRFARAKVVCFDDLGSYGLLASLEATPVLDDFVDSAVGALASYDARKGSELMATLQAYLSTGANLSSTAKLLHVHRNTLKYRLARIAELSGLDPDDPNDRFNLQLATSMWAVRHAIDDAGTAP